MTLDAGGVRRLFIYGQNDWRFRRPALDLFGVELRALFIALLTVCMAWGCARDVPRVSTETASRSAVILVPGYYGTRLLREGDDRLMWLSTSQALGDGPSLTLPLADLGLSGASLRPDGILEQIAIVPWVYRIDAYESMLKTLRSSGLRTVTFSYDWREDLMPAVRSLHDTIAGLKRDGIEQIVVVAHSMGGLIACYYLRYGMQEPETAKETWEGADKITAVVVAGVPFEGSMTVFRNMTYGRPIGWNETLLSFETVSSFPASYYLLPHTGTDVLFSQGGLERQGLISDAANWDRYHWGLLREKNRYSSALASKRLAYIAKWLKHVDRFHDLVHASQNGHAASEKPFMWVGGTGRRTLAKGILHDDATGKASITFEDASLAQGAYQPTLFEPGDGTVTYQASALPDAYARRFVITNRLYEAEHIELMNREDIRQDILGFIVKEIAAASLLPR